MLVVYFFLFFTRKINRASLKLFCRPTGTLFSAEHIRSKRSLEFFEVPQSFSKNPQTKKDYSKSMSEFDERRIVGEETSSDGRESALKLDFTGDSSLGKTSSLDQMLNVIKSLEKRVVSLQEELNQLKRKSMQQ